MSKNGYNFHLREITLKSQKIYISYGVKLKFHILREIKINKKEYQVQNDMSTKPLGLNRYKQLWNNKPERERER